MGGSWDLAFQDILAAFEHYLSESSRPFVLAGHSQGLDSISRAISRPLKGRKELFEALLSSFRPGSMHIVRLVKERIACDEALLKRLVAVHAPGMGRRPTALPNRVKDERNQEK